MQLENKIIWITGASSGIGMALALELSKLELTLILSGRNMEALNSVKKDCESGKAKCMVVQLDLCDESSIVKAHTLASKEYPKIDILVNNGGISQRANCIETPLEVDRKIMETNFFGSVSLTKKIIPAMAKNNSGHIVVISSIVGKFGFPLRTAYSASKHALQGYFESLRAELVPDNIGVTIVSPGRISTNISLNAIDKDGKQHGVMDPGQANGMPSDKCAKAILKAIRKNKKELLVGGKETIMVKIRKYFPSLFYRMASKVKPT